MTSRRQTQTDPTRSRIMRAVPRTDTKPEVRVRKFLHRLGYRFRLHVKSLPGTPDIVLPKHRTVIFVHGCFWHRHENCRFATTPKTRQDFWQEKFDQNMERDWSNVSELENLGWRIVTIWECETKDHEVLGEQILRIFSTD